MKKIACFLSFACTTRGVSIRFSGKRKPEEKVKNIRFDFKFILNFTFLETVPVVRKSGSRFDPEKSRRVHRFTPSEPIIENGVFSPFLVVLTVRPRK